MADEWDDFASSGKSFGGGNYVGEATNGDSSAPAEDTWNTNNGFGDGNDGGFNADGGYGDDEQRGDRGGHGSGRGRGRGRGGRGGGGGFGGRRDDGDRRERNYGDRDDDGDGNNRRGRGGGRGGRGGRGGGGGRGFDDNDDQNDGGNQVAEKPREFYIPPEPTEDDEEIFHSGISSGINFDKYDNIPVKISPGAPAPISTFAESGLRPFLLENIKKSGYSRPTPVQKYALPVILSGKDLMACAQTGSGKTAAYLLPMIEYFLEKKDNVSVGKPHGLIVSPTRELSIQIFSEARKFARGSILKISLVYGGTAVKHQGDNIAKGCHLLVCTPGRLLDFVEKGFITFEDLKFVVLDEADRMLDMGFLPNVETIMNAPHMRPMEERQTLMFSATFPEEIQRLAGKFLNDYVFLTIGIVGGACADVDQNFYKVTKFEKRGKLTEILENSEPGGTIVFVETKRNADFLASLLSETSFPTTSIHGDRLQRERELALSDFKSGKRSILIATSVAARGLDIKNVAHVINYDLPQKIDEYVHRIGRTGRVGNCGKATSFYNPDEDYALAPDLVKILKQANKPVPDFLLSVDGGGSSYGGGRNRGGGNRFGGRDVRDNTVDASDFSRGCAISEPQSQEPEELW